MASDAFRDDWIGRERTAADTLDARQSSLMEGLVPDGSGAYRAGLLAPLRHWLHFPEAVPLSGLGPDGHPARGDFPPPIPLPRRMWAGGALTFHHPLTLGQDVSRRSRIANVTKKAGRTSPLYFVKVEQEITSEGALCISETQEIVYRSAPGPDRPPSIGRPAPWQAEITETIAPSPVMLFRFSALTYNAHRIHYDRDYCRDVEGYPGLVVHGPLTALLLADLGTRVLGGPAGQFSFRAEAPLFDTEEFTINATSTTDGVDLWACRPDDTVAMSAKATPR